MRIYDHVHKYERRRLGSWKTKGHEVYKCALPDCNHYVVDMELVIGRYSQCWEITGTDLEGNPVHCPNEVEMTRFIVFNEKRKHPLCDECKQRRKREREFKKEEQNTELMAKRMEAIEKLMKDTEGKDVKIDYEQ